MNKYTLGVLSAVGGAFATLLVTHAFASTDTYRQLNLFGDVFERVKNDYVREVKDGELVEAAINERALPELAGYASLRREVRYGASSRIDLMLEDPAKGLCFVEIKNVHLMRKAGVAEFPDSVTARGAKHLDELAAEAARGNRAVMLFLIQRGDAREFRLARDIDPAYASAFARAAKAGVEMLAYTCALSPDAIDLGPACPVRG